ncbi:MAG: GNAT family N-acetyltransferase [Candidatus Hodarchaeales archaeon]|jgi:diamine N-acetyltransferase
MTNFINLRAITSKNYREIIALKVSSDQEDFVAPNVYTIAQMQFKQEKIALAIYSGDVPVGLIAYDLDDYDIWRLMIDHRFQRQGFGRQALNHVIEILKHHNKLPEIRTSAIVSLNGPLAFYKKLGFQENGEVLEYDKDGTPHEIVLTFPLRNNK